MTSESLQLGQGSIDPSFNPNIDASPGSASAAASQPDGKVLIGGAFKSVNGFSTSGIIRVNQDRSIDTTFSTAIFGTVFTIVVQPDGKILIGGTFVAVNGVARNSIARLNIDGSLDTTFTTGSGTDNIVRDIALQADGKVLIAGGFVFVNGIYSPKVARLNAGGQVDSTFTSVTRPSTSSGVPANISDIDLQPDNKIVLAGLMVIDQGGPLETRFIMRINSDGSIDPSFTSPSMNSNPIKVAVQPDGKIVMAGFFVTVNGVNRNRLARLNADGTLDTTFDPGTGANASVLYIALQPNGKFFVSGTFTAVNGVTRGGVARLNSNGSLDADFSPAGGTVGPVNFALPHTSGVYVGGSFSIMSGVNRRTLAVLSDNGAVDETFLADFLRIGPVRAIVLQAGGKILIGGFFTRVNGVSRVALARLNPDGSLDSSFDTQGISAASVSRLVAQPDGKILVLGSGLRIGTGPFSVMVRLNSDGTPDNSFTMASIPQVTAGSAAAIQQDGKILFSYGLSTPSPNNGGISRLNPDGSIDSSFSSFSLPFEGIAVLPNGQIMVAGPFSIGYVSPPAETEFHNAVMRLNADGSHDRTFRSGLASNTQGSGFSAVYALMLQPDGKVLVGGTLFTGGSALPFGVVRLNATGTIDGSFQTNPISSSLGNALVRTIVRTPDDKLLVGGNFNNYGGNARNNMLRLESNGTLDQAFTANTDSVVNAIVVEADGDVLFGGDFERVNGIPRTSIARIILGQNNRTLFDYDGDGRADLSVSRPSSAVWYVQNSSDNSYFAVQFGLGTDAIVPQDYDGDGRTDVAVYRPENGLWYWFRSSDGTIGTNQFGTTGDRPVPQDYDGDGKADVAIFRPGTGTWWVYRSSDNQVTATPFGLAEDQPTLGDFDGDGRGDLAVFRPSTGVWYRTNSGNGSFFAVQFGIAGDKPVPADFDGDGKTDVAVYRPADGNWFKYLSSNGTVTGEAFGTSGDKAVAADYDGDGRADVAVFRPSNGTWYANRTTAGVYIQQFGTSEDRPTPNSFVP